MIVGLVAILTVGLRAASGGGPADTGADDKKEPVGSVVETSKRLEDHIGHIDWEAERPFIEQAVERFWERNGWTAEPDLATRDLACEVAAIPPWQMMKRLDLMCQRVGERYDYSPEQAAQFKGAIMRETSSWLTHHAGTIFEHIREGLPVEARAGAPHPEQVARWTKASEALVADARAAFDRVVDEIRPTFTSEQNEILEPDLRAFNKRWNDVQQMRARWAAGGWRPDDWGIPADSDLRAGLADVKPEPARPGGVSGEVISTREAMVVPKWVAHDPSTWFAYVLETAKRYDLSPGQMTAAWSVHAEIVSRANAYILTHADRLQPVPIRARSMHVAYGPIRLLFEELKDRLEVIPTTAQRAARAS
ncbi:MAG: hypothetical protein ACYTFA_10705 [Planctomycetota bacterium]|jgi:hypothetical protein